MSARPLLLDLFCGAGGAAMGYHRAGFEVVGVDYISQKHYPFRLIQADALEYVAAHGHEYAAIHASPPCQKYSPLNARCGYKHTIDLVGPTRDALLATGKPYVIENVPGAPLRASITLCGTMFDLRVYRHRRFETSFAASAPAHPPHTVRAGGHKAQRQRKAHYLAGGFVTITGNVGSYCGPAMGIDWMTGKELSQAIPPAYTLHVGAQLLRAIA